MAKYKNSNFSRKFIFAKNGQTGPKMAQNKAIKFFEFFFRHFFYNCVITFIGI